MGEDTGEVREHEVFDPVLLPVVDEETGIPSHDPATMRTNVPGLYIAGVIAAGHNANKIFIENGREHGGLIVADRLTGDTPTS